MNQQFYKHHGSRPPSDDGFDDGATQSSGQVQIDTSGLDSVLDDIDDMLEDNASEFVRNFVQKGGQ